MKNSEPVVSVLPVLGHQFMPATDDDSASASTEQLLREYLHQPSKNESRRNQVKRELDALLQRILDREDPRVVFKLDPPSNSGAEYREQAICMEVLYLISEGVGEAKAKELVCTAYANRDFKMSMRTIQAAVAKWRDHPWFTDKWVRAYGLSTQPERQQRKNENQKSFLFS